MDTKTKSKSIKKPMTLMIILLIVIFGGLVAFNVFRSMMIKKYFSTFQPPPVTISASIVKTQTWFPFISATGSLTAINGVDINPELAGQVQEIYFKSGQLVKKGEPLIQLDDDVDQQNLINEQAELKLAEVSYQRQQKLFQQNATPKSQLDTAEATLQEAQASVQKAKVTIDKKTIKAPFAGKIGIRKVNLGQYVTAGEKLVTLQSMNPLFVEFSLPEQYLPQLTANQTVTLEVAAFPKELFQGKITAIDSKINVLTRNITIQATIPNPNTKLYPGMFADIQVLLPEKQNVVTVPQTAIAYSLYGDSIFVIKEKGKDKKGKPILKAYRQYITVGQRQGSHVAISKGLKAGQQVVTSGQLKLENGTRVLINNSVKLTSRPMVQLYN